MSHTWELQQYVEAHPDNHEQRWRLAKRLYTEGDYRAALEHLHILTNEWDAKPNVIRYHAATLTRLNRPKEAVKILEKASRDSPNDAGLLEQLAMAYTRANELEDAASIWGDIAAMQPAHTYARRAQDKILRELRSDRQRRDEGSSGEGTVPCSRCGTMNSPEEYNCVNCNQQLDLGEEMSGFAEPEESLPQEAAGFDPVPWMVRGLLLVSLIYSVYAMLEAFGARDVYALDNHAVYVSWSELLAMDLLPTHMIVSAVLLIAWPLVLRGAELGAGIGGWFTVDTALTGGAWALFAIAVSWIPGVGVVSWALIVLGVTLAGTWLEYRDRVWVGLRVWIIEISLIALVIVISIVAAGGPALMVDVLKVDAFSRTDHTPSQAQITGTLDTPRTIRTISSRSGWIDDRAKGMALKLTVPPDAVEREMTLQVVQQDRTLLYERIVAAEQYFDIETVLPGVDTTVELQDGGGVPVTLELRGVLPITELQSAP